jgi:hypothetical protein
VAVRRQIRQSRQGNAEAMRQAMLAGGKIARLYDPSDPHHPRDLNIALDIDRIHFAIRVKKENSRPAVRMERRA